MRDFGGAVLFECKIVNRGVTMLSLVEIMAIPFASSEELEWDNWPDYSLGDRLPDNTKAIYSGDMAQICYILTKNGCDYLVANADNEIGFLQAAIEAIFPGNFTWYDIRSACGVYDYFWYCYYLECGYNRICELPEWCNSVLQTFIDEGIVTRTNGTAPDEYYYCFCGFSNILNRDLSSLYEKLETIFLAEASRYYSETGEIEEIPDAQLKIRTVIDGLIGR